MKMKNTIENSSNNFQIKFIKDADILRTKTISSECHTVNTQNEKTEGSEAY